MDITSFIHKNAQYFTIDRGKSLFAQNRVQLIFNNPTSKIAGFEVMGSKPYNIQIDYSDNIKWKFKTKCDCPYSENYRGICKHIIAALFYLENKVNLEIAVNGNFRNSSNFYEYPDIHNIKSDNNLFFSNVNPKEIELSIKDFSISKIIFEYQHKNNYWSQYVNHTLTFKFENGALKSKCSCNKMVRGNCEHEMFVLNFLNKNFDNNIFTIFNNELLEQKFKPIIDDTGLDFKTFMELFTIHIQKNSIVWIPKDGSFILSKSIMNDIFADKEKSNAENRITEMFKQAELFKKRDIGLVINGSYYLEFTPVSANVNKGETEMISSFSLVDQNDKILLFKNKDGFDDLIKNYIIVNNLINDRNNNDELIFKKYQEIFANIKKFKFIYYNTNHHSNQNRYEYSRQNLYIVKRDLININIRDEKVLFKFKYFEEKNMIGIKPCLYLDSGVEIEPSSANSYHLGFLIIDDESLHIFNSYNDYKFYKDNSHFPSIKTVVSNKIDFVKKVIIPNSKKIDIDFSEYLNFEKVDILPKEKNIFLSDVDGYMIFTVNVVYEGNISINPLESYKHYDVNESGKIIQNCRNLEFETEFINTLLEIQPLWKTQTENDFFHLPMDVLMTDMWFFKAFEKFTENNIQVFGLSKLKYFKYNPHKPVITSHIKSGQDWFDIEIEIKFGEENVKLSDIKKAIKNKNNYVLLSDGTYGILPKEWLEKFERYFRAGEISKNNLKISKLKFNFIDEFFSDIDQEEILKEIFEKKKQLQTFHEIQNTTIPIEIKANLRNYQKEGLNWLNFLHEFKWGGILADDMGLGKTLQIITFLKQIEKKSSVPNLIVVPTTLIFNWESEFQKFAPNTPIFYYYGINREKNPDVLKKQNIIITSYGTLVNDIEIFHKLKFNYVILDESQAIKNPTSLRYKSVCLLKAYNRIVCTGTPIENNTFDLYAQFSFLNPGFLGSQASFKDDFSIPIDKDKDEKIATELQKLIHPFVLRRTKEQVINELPPKTENILYCNMDEEQMNIYTAYRNKYRDYLLKKIDEEGLEKSKLFVLEGLLKLRQICDSPEILSDDEYYGNQSIKIKELLNHIENKTGKHKILIFSQFVSMLKLIQKALNEHSIKYEYLDGQCNTKQRQNSVENFQNNEDVRVFLISLKAGGLGLNLTAADYVYIVDPWWNPAVENQAIDRCYRIGQDKKVFAYRMICKNTVEEKILALQDTKKQIAENIIQTDESVLKKINKEDILNLFS